MSYNGSGTFVINTAGQPVVSGTVISSTAFNALTADLANGLSTAITKDGQTTPTANIPMGNNKITALANGTAATDAANLGQVQSTTAKLINSISGADTITGTLSPTLTSYAAGQMFYFVAAGDNTGAVTLNINSLGVKSVTRDGTTALVAGDIKSGEVVVVVYDGTQFQVVSQLNSSGDARFANVSIASALNVGGVSTLTGAVNIAGAVSIASSMSVVGVFTATGGSTLNGGVVINEPGADADFRVESDTDANCLFVDASANNVGIGTSSPAAKLDVRGGAVFANYGGTGTAFFATDGVSSEFDVAIATNLTTIKNNGGAASLAFATAGSERLRIDSSGNLGLGVTPSAWGTSGTVLKAIQLGSGSNGGNFVAGGNGFVGSFIGANAYYNGTNWIYASSTGASYYNPSGTGHAWFTAPSGTAGNTISFTQAMTLDASGNLAVGDTANSAAARLYVKGSGATSGSVAMVVRNSTPADLLYIRNDGYIGFGLNATAMTLDASGNLLVGTTTSAYTTSGRVVSELNGSSSSLLALKTSDTARGYFAVSTTATELAAVGASQPLLFTTNSAERARITSGGELLVGVTAVVGGERLNVTKSSAANYVAYVENTSNASGDQLHRFKLGANCNDTNSYHLICTTGASDRLYIYGNGNVVNTNGSYGTISDAKMKTDIVDAGSQWDDLKAVRFRKFKMKNDPSGIMQLGVVAQELEQVSPGLISEHPDRDAEGNDLGTTTKSVKTSVLLMKAAVALQEAMARIEQLEAKVAALESK